MVRSVLGYTVACLMFCVILCPAHGADPPTTATYARLALPPKGDQVLLLKFRSDGRATMRNVVLADLNFNGVLEPSEKLAGQVRERKTRDYASGDCAFPGITIALPGDGPCAGSNRLTIHSAYFRVGRQRAQEHCYAETLTRMGSDGEAWAYDGTCGITAGPSMECEPCGATDRIAMTLATQPDGVNEGQTGFEVQVMAPMLMIRQVSLNEKPCLVSLEVADADGKVVHENAAEISKMAFG